MGLRSMIQNYRKPDDEGGIVPKPLYPWQGGPMGTGGNPGPGGGHSLPVRMPQINIDRPGQQNLMNTPGDTTGESTGGYGNSFLGTFMNLAKWAVPYAGREGLKRTKNKLNLYDKYGLLDKYRDKTSGGLGGISPISGREYGKTYYNEAPGGGNERAFGNMSDRESKLQENWGKIGSSNGKLDKSKTAQEASDRYKKLFDEPEFDENGFVITR